MAWIVIEGIDRSFKSSAAKLYEAKGFKVIHFSAPDKKILPTWLHWADIL